MRSYSFRTAGPRLPSFTQLILIFAVWRFLPAVPGALLGAAGLAASFWGLLLVESVSIDGDEFFLELRMCGVPLGRARRARKADVERAGLERAVFYRWLRSDGQKTLLSRYTGWTATLYCRIGPSRSTRLPLNDADSDALLSFLRGELGHD